MTTTQQRAPGGSRSRSTRSTSRARQQPGGQRGAAAGRQPLQPGRARLDRRGRRQRQLGPGAAEGDQADLVAPLVGVQQQRQHRALDRRHPLAGGHRAGGVDHEQHEVALAALADRLRAGRPGARTSPRPGPPARRLVRARRPQRWPSGAAWSACRPGGGRTGRAAVVGTGPGPAARRALAEPGDGEQTSSGTARRPARRAARRVGPAGGWRGRPGRRRGRWDRRGRRAARAARRRRGAGRRDPADRRELRGSRGRCPGRPGQAAAGAVRAALGVLGAAPVAPGRAPDSLQRLVELVLVEAGRVERVAAAPVRQREQRGLPDVLARSPRSARPRRPARSRCGPSRCRRACRPPRTRRRPRRSGAARASPSTHRGQQLPGGDDALRAARPPRSAQRAANAAGSAS